MDLLTYFLNGIQNFSIASIPCSKIRLPKKDGAILDIYHYGVSITIRNLLIENFDITENDFRAIRNKKGEIVFYQITPQHTMQPLIGENSIKQLKPCSKCGSIQYRIKEFKN